MRGCFIGICLLIFTSLTTANEAEQDFYEKALLFYQQQEPEKALNVVKTALKIKPEHLPSRILYGEILLQFGEFAAAETQFKRALSFKADTVLVLPKLAQALLIQNKFNELLDTVKADSSSEEVNFAILMYRGQAWQSLRRFDEALTAFDQALLLRPRSISTILAKANIAKSQGQHARYKALLTEAERIAPTNPTLLYFKGEMARKVGDNNEALALYERILQLHPDYKDVQRSRAALLLETGQVDKAVADIESLLASAPTDPYTRLLQAVALSRADTGRESKQVLNDVVDTLSVIDKDLYQEFAPIHFINGAAHFLLQEYEQAERHLKRALDVDPNNISIREMLSEIAAINQQHRVVIDLLDPIPVNQLTLRAADMLVAAWFFVENFNLAKDLLLELPQEIGAQPYFVKMLSTAWFKLGNVDAGIKVLFQHNLVNSDKTAALMLGYHALNIRDLRLAFKIAQRFEAAEDNDYVILNYIGAVYMAGNRLDEAIEFFQRAKQAQPQDLISGLNLMRAYRAMGDEASAGRELLTLERLYPSNADVLAAKVELARSNAQQAEYQTSLAKLVAARPDNRELVLEYIDVLLQQGRMDDALEQVEGLREQHTFWPPAIVAHAKIYIAKQEYTKAQRPLRALFGLVDRRAQLIELGELFLSAQDFEYTEKAIERAEKDPAIDHDLARLKIKLLYMQGQKAEATTQLQTLVAKSNNYENQILLASYLADQARMQPAIEAGLKAYQLKPERMAVQLLASWYWQTNQAEQALQLMKSHLELDQAQQSTRLTYANMLQQLGRQEQAMEQYLLVLSQEPSNLFSLVNLTQLYILRGEFQLAELHVQQAANIKQDDALILDLQGWVTVNKGELNRGLDLLRSSYSRNSSNPSNLYHLAYTLHQLNRREEAKRMLDRALMLNREFPERQLAELLKAQL